MREPTIPIYFVREILLRFRGKPEFDELLARNNIPQAILSEDSARIHATSYANLLRDAMVTLGDEILGHGSAIQPAGSWEIMCHSVLAADNLLQAMDRYTRFYSLFDWGITPQLVDNGDTVSLTLLSADNRNLRPYLYESFLFYSYRFSNWLVAKQIPLIQVDFHFPRPSHASQHMEMFFCNHVNYSAPHTRLEFSSNLLQLPVRQTSSSLKKFLRHPNFEMIVQQYGQKSWQYKVQTLINKHLDENPSLAWVAEQMGVHPQTVRRHLDTEGFSFQGIKDQVRRDAAIYMLGERGSTVEETAIATGFSEASSFIKSFKKWTGVTPLIYRKRR